MPVGIRAEQMDRNSGSPEDLDRHPRAEPSAFERLVHSILAVTDERPQGSLGTRLLDRLFNVSTSHGEMKTRSRVACQHECVAWTA